MMEVDTLFETLKQGSVQTGEVVLAAAAMLMVLALFRAVASG
jgi:hypothetical protein